MTVKLCLCDHTSPGSGLVGYVLSSGGWITSCSFSWVLPSLVNPVGVHSLHGSG